MADDETAPMLQDEFTTLLHEGSLHPATPRGVRAQAFHRYVWLPGSFAALALLLMFAGPTSWFSKEPPRIGVRGAVRLHLDEPLPKQAEFITNAESTVSFKWTAPLYTVEEAMRETFVKGGNNWTDTCFSEGACEDGRGMTQEALSAWVKKELLGGPDPFASYAGKVPLPWPEKKGLHDQLDNGHYVGYSRRQVCYIVAKTLTGAKTDGYNNGLARILGKTVAGENNYTSYGMIPGCQPANGTALNGEFGASLWHLLRACAADPGLSGGGQGPLLLVTKGGERRDPGISSLRKKGRDTPLTGAGLRVCHYDDAAGSRAAPASGVLPSVPEEGCVPPDMAAHAPGVDFMTGGLKGQAVQDISASFLGGYVFGNACGLGGGQDERLMVYFPEVFALAFFLSQDADFPQLRQPAWVLGARMLMVGLDGTARFNKIFKLDPDVPLTSDIVDVEIAGATYNMSSSRPFLAFMSENQDLLGEGGFWNGSRSFEDMAGNLSLARQNRHPSQRATGPDSGSSFGRQVRAWYSAVALTSYNRALHPVLQKLVRSMGVGPWLAGLWWGDSQLGWLAVWIGHALAAPTWGGEGLPVDYYVYADFTENPGNQCFVLPWADCQICLDTCLKNELLPESYWLPTYAFMGPGHNRSCVADAAKHCGQNGLEHVAHAYKKRTAGQLWDDVEAALEGGGPDVDRTVFDLLLVSKRPRRPE